MNANPYPADEEISLRDVVLKFRELRKELLARWTLVITGILLTGGAIFVALTFKNPVYSAKLTFVVEEAQQASMLAKYSSLMSQFGFNLGGDATLSEDNMIELLKSRVIIEDALLGETGVAGVPGTLADYYIEFSGIRESWADATDADKLAALSFRPPNRAGMTRLHDSILGVVYNDLVENRLTVEKVSNNASIVAVLCETEDQLFSKLFCERLVKSVSDFYVGNKTHKARETLSYVQYRADSVRQALSAAEMQLARWEDSNRQMLRAEGYLTEIKLRREVSILNVMYAEIVKNLEMSKMILLDQTPVIQVIDKPILPLEESGMTPLKGGVFGAFAGFVLAAIYVVARKLLRDAMAVQET